jgi:hypothetical protein
MKNVQPKKVEIMVNRKRFVVSEAAARIAIDTLGATEVVPFEKPLELRARVPIIQPEYKEIKVVEIKPPEIKSKLVDIPVEQIKEFKTEPVKESKTRAKRTKK